MTRLVIFDVAGTTALDGDLVIDAMSEALAADGLAVDRDWIRVRMGLPKPVVIRELISRLSGAGSSELDPKTERIHRAFLDLAERGYRQHADVRETPGAREVFHALHEQQIKVALDTGFNRTTLNVLLERLGWNMAGLIDCSVASDEVTRGRPAPHLIRRAMQLVGVDDPRTVIKVGDTPADIESGWAADCGAVIGVSYGTHSREELEPYGPTRVIDALTDLLHVVKEVSLP